MANDLPTGRLSASICALAVLSHFETLLVPPPFIGSMRCKIGRGIYLDLYRIPVAVFQVLVGLA
jgi:hypothetical protein